MTSPSLLVLYTCILAIVPTQEKECFAIKKTEGAKIVRLHCCGFDVT